MLALAVALAWSEAGSRANASQASTNLHSFAGPDGSHPRATLALGNDGFIYGTTLQGGTSNLGTVFRITRDGVLTTLHSFTGSDGAGGYGLTSGRDGNFYGTTSGGGASTNGTIFSIGPSGAFASLHSFNRADGAAPFAALAQGTDGNFYGTTYQGGLSNRGTVFRITPGGSFTSLHSFVSTDGINPYGALVQGVDGNLYGTTHGGGTNALAVGTVFRISPDGSGFTNIYHFHATDGSSPFGGLALGVDGNFYGTTFAGGANNGVSGTVFRLTPNGLLTLLHSFVSGEGYNPQAGLLLGDDGNCYGTTTSGGFANLGTIFRITPDGSYGIMYSFQSSDGGMPFGGMIQDTNGSFYCTTYTNAASGLGSVFKLTLPVCTNIAAVSGCICPTLLTLHSFSGGDGSGPNAELTLGPDGNFYGTTLQGGNSSFGTTLGTIFRVSPTGTLTTLYKFAGFPNDGQNPYGGLVFGPDGYFYGTATAAGLNNGGSFFRISPEGVLTNLHGFVSTSDGNSPESSLVLGSDGNYYGTCTGGGTGRRGTVFRITRDGVLTVLHSFSGTDGDTPFAGVVEGSDGNFYGTTSYGGTARTGSVYRVSAAGVFVNLHSFNGVDGRYPQGELVEGSDRNFYGTTVGGGGSPNCPGGCGTVFRISPTGEFATLYSFRGPDGSSPFCALLRGSDGNFYGTTDGGGDYTGIGGTIFQITPTGQLTTLYTFTGGGDGRGPLVRLVQGNDGALYGTTYYGGSSANCSLGCGTVFKLCIPLPAPVNQISSAAGTAGNITLNVTTLAGRAYQLQSRDALGAGNWANLGSPVSAPGGPISITNLVDPLVPQRFFRFRVTP